MSSVTLPITFKAVGCQTPNGPFALINRTVQSLQPHELLVRESHCAVNQKDAKIHETNLAKLPMPMDSMVLGYDFSGVVVAAGGAEDKDGAGQTSKDAVTVGSAVMGQTYAIGSALRVYTRHRR